MNREKNVNRAVMKKDAMALVTGKPVYTDDLAPKDCLIIKILKRRSNPGSARMEGESSRDIRMIWRRKTAWW